MLKRFSLAVCLTLAAALPVAAAPFTLGYTDTTAPISAHNGYGRTGIKIKDPTPVLSSDGWLNVSAGAFDVTVTSGSHGVAHLANSFAAFCLDLDQWLSMPSQYEVTSTPFAGNALSSMQNGAIQALFNTGYNPANLGNDAYSAGFQLALWEIVNEVLDVGETYDVTTGDFFTKNEDSGDNAARTAANTLLAGLTGPQTGNWRLVFLQSRDGNDGGDKRDSQNLVTVAPVPLPAAGWVFLAALGGLGLAARRRRRAA